MHFIKFMSKVKHRVHSISLACLPCMDGLFISLNINYFYTMPAILNLNVVWNSGREYVLDNLNSCASVLISALKKLKRIAQNLHNT